MRILAALIFLLAINVHGQVLRKIDYGKMADVNGKMLSSDQLQYQTIPSKYRTTTRSPFSDKSVETGTVPVVILDEKRTDEKVLNLSNRAYSTLPQKNFTAKWAAESEKSAQKDKVVENKAAPVTDRTIHANTAAGEAELKDQLRKLKTHSGE